MAEAGENREERPEGPAPQAEPCAAVDREAPPNAAEPLEPAVAPQAPAPPEAVPGEQVLAALQALQEQLAKHLADTASCSREAFDRLYDELRQYKQNFILEVQRALLTDVMTLYDSIAFVKRTYDQKDVVPVEELRQNLNGLLVESEEVLARRGILPIVELGDKLVRETQKAVRTVPTDKPEEDMAIVERRKTGFQIGAIVFRREEVVVKKYAEAPAGAK